MTGRGEQNPEPPGQKHRKNKKRNPKPKTQAKKGLTTKETTKETTKKQKERPATENTPGKPKTSEKSIGLRGSDDMFRLSRSVSTKEYMTE